MMPVEYRLNNKVIYPCKQLPGDDFNPDKYMRVFEPSTQPFHRGRELIVRKEKIRAVEATNPFERLQNDQDRKER